MGRGTDNLAAQALGEEVRWEVSLRPKNFSDYVGQTTVVDKLKVYAGPEHPHAAQRPKPLA